MDIKCFSSTQNFSFISSHQAAIAKAGALVVMDIKCFSFTQNFSFIFRYVEVGLALTGAVHPLGQPQHLGRHLSTESLTPEDHCTFQTSGDNTQAPWRSTRSKAEQTRTRWRSE